MAKGRFSFSVIKDLLKTFFKKLGIVVLKNLLLRKSQYVVTILEIIIPIIFVAGSVLLQLLLSGFHPYDYDPFSGSAKPTISEKDLKAAAGSEYDITWCKHDKSDPEASNFIAYTPNSSATTEIIEKVAKEFCAVKGSRSYPAWIPVANESDLEKKYADEWGAKGNFLGAVVFFSELDELTQPGGVISYKIRMRAHHFPSTRRLFPNPNKEFALEANDYTRIGPNKRHAKLYMKTKFLGLQFSIDKVLAEKWTGESFRPTLTLEPFPYPPYTSGEDLRKTKGTGVSSLLAALNYGMYFFIASITRNVVAEKQTGISELLRMTGVSSGIQWLGWLIHAVIPSIIYIPVITIFYLAPILQSGPLLEKVDPFLFFIVLWMFIYASAAFVFFICALFKKPTLATVVAILIFQISQFGAAMILVSAGTTSLGTKMSLLLLPNGALTAALMNIDSMEYLAVDESDVPIGARWTNLHLPVPISDKSRGVSDSHNSLSNLHIIGMLLVDIILYMTLAVYLEGVLPTEHGVRRPWYYFRCERKGKQSSTSVAPATTSPNEPQAIEKTPDEKVSDAANTAETGDGTEQSSVDAPKPEPSKPSIQNEEPLAIAGFEPEPVDAIVGIHVENISKRFNRRAVAVNGVSVNMYSGDIFALLGHNGAGKTTLISMLTGFFPPSSGTAFINGHDIRQDLEKARDSMGLCPQHDMIFDMLTVSQQLRLFGLLRGLSWRTAKSEANTLLAMINLSVKASTLAKYLSGGQKRKLCLAMALIGGTKVVVLDEPTSGMDPQARREIWDLLLHLRGQRTILLTTHFMEEADVLGDRIGIMANGALQCCGTAAFLKKYYGTGYTLKLTLQGGGKSQEASVNPSPSPSTQQVTAEVHPTNTEVLKFNAAAADAILVAVQKQIPDAIFKTETWRLRSSNDCVFISLPAETATTSALGLMFSDLTTRKDKLGIKTIGLSPTTMDEVFIRVGELAEEGQYGAQINPDGIDAFGFQRAEKVTKNVFLEHFTALLMKKFIHSIRKWTLLIFEILLPLVIWIVVVHRTNSHAEPHEYEFSPVAEGGDSKIFSLPPNVSLPISLNDYQNPTTYLYFNSPQNPDLMADVIGPSYKWANVNISTSLLNAGKKDIKSYKRNHIIAAEMTKTELKVFFNLYPYHSAPLAINLATNVLLKYMKPSGDYWINVENHPFYHKLSPPPPQNISNESTTSTQRPDTDDGVLTYFNRAWNIVTLLKTVVPLALLFLVCNFVVIPIEEKVCQAKQLQMMTGVNPLVYWGATFAWDYLFYTLIILLMFCYLLVFEYALGYAVLSSNWGFFVFLFIAMSYGIPAILFAYLISLRAGTVTGGFAQVLIIHLLTGLVLSLILEPNQLEGIPIALKVFAIIFYLIGRCFPTFSLTRALNEYALISVMNSNCPLLHTEIICPAPNPYLIFIENEKPGILLEIMVLVLLALVYAGILALVEFRIISDLWHKMTKGGGGGGFQPNINDDDVFDEVDRVNMLLASGQMDEDCLLVQNLNKSFGSFVAVNQLNFGVHHGECFGLLGVNGAGKTTAFRIITGDIMASFGNVFGFGTSLDRNLKKFLSNIGYCPQFDALFGHFTGKEMLQLFAGLRGVPYKTRGIEAINWLSRMKLLESGNVKCGNYSGGMKRRLSTAIALIGDPTLILLDEPTSGVDPTSRRQFWRILDKMRESGQSIIFTSHSMEECEALCSRLGIMVNGQFQCFGGVQHLKNKFAQGYSLTLKLKPELTAQVQETDAVKGELYKLHEKISGPFSPCFLKDKHQNLLQYQLNNPSITWDVLFKTMEEIKKEFSNLIEDYSVNETSLEDVFLAFARQQYSQAKPPKSLCKKICTCSC